MILVYNLFEGEYGGVYLMIIPSKELYLLIPEYGGYAHGTNLKNGKITMSNLWGSGYEYALRPNPRKKGTKSCELWEIMNSRWNRLGSDIGIY